MSFLDHFELVKENDKYLGVKSKKTGSWVYSPRFATSLQLRYNHPYLLHCLPNKLTKRLKNSCEYDFLSSAKSKVTWQNIIYPAEIANEIAQLRQLKAQLRHLKSYENPNSDIKEKITKLKKYIKENDPRTKEEKAEELKFYRSFFAKRSGYVASANKWIHAILSREDQKLLKLARRFHPSLRRMVFVKAEKHPYIAQMFETFPVLAFIADEKDIISGKKMKKIASSYDIPLYYKNVLPGCAHILLSDNETSKELRNFDFPNKEIIFKDLMPKKTMTQYRYLSVLEKAASRNLAANPEHKNYLKWLSYALRDSVAKTKLAMIFTESLDVRDAFLDTPWPTDVSWTGGMERSRIWHENIHLRRQMQYDKEFQKPFADPWIEGVEDEKADLKIVPLTCPKDLFQDGQAMKHCVATYASRVRGNSCYIYSLRDMKDNRIATIEICRSQLSDVLYIDQFVVNNNVKYFVSQIRGHCNQNLDSKYRAFVEKWIADAKASKAA